MKYILAVALLAVLGCATNQQSDVAETKIKTEVRTIHKEWEAQPGEIHSTDTVFRGKERVLRTFKFRNKTTKNWGVWQFFYIDGKAVMIIEDNADGKLPTVTLIKDDRTYDEFRRQADGALEPLSNEELAKIQKQEREDFGPLEHGNKK